MRVLEGGGCRVQDPYSHTSYRGELLKQKCLELWSKDIHNPARLSALSTPLSPTAVPANVKGKEKNKVVESSCSLASSLDIMGINSTHLTSLRGRRIWGPTPLFTHQLQRGVAQMKALRVVV
ncbi:hypothetical protein H5410_002531 [Solanum commersonii]|uniref:Uncharacterized protein n=1 Tax=Solanum commersonii TaxID=4109 RepID=A0A9J6B267_SOLCO|nr:hypothetical protein H5410_002531 [Solanum commersonii]